MKTRRNLLEITSMETMCLCAGCVVSRCQNGGTCVPDGRVELYGNSTDHCECPPGYKGAFCEYGTRRFHWCNTSHLHVPSIRVVSNKAMTSGHFG